MEDIPNEKRFFPAIIDYRARHSPEETLVFLPKGNELQDGFFALTYQAAAKAVDATAWWLDSVLGGKVDGNDFPSVPYIGANDFRYGLLMAAAIKTKRKFVIPLLSNTPEGQIKLLKLTDSTVVFASKGHERHWKNSLAEMDDLKLIEVPEIGEFINEKSVEPYPYSRNYNDVCNEPLFVIQTSGTTGSPKPLLYNHAAGSFLMGMAAASQPGDPAMFPALLNGSYMANTLPLSWSAGLAMVTTFPVAYNCKTILLPTSLPGMLTPFHINEILKHVPRGESNSIPIIPDLLRKMIQEPEYLERLKQVDWVGYAGAPLDHATGDIVKKVTRVQSLMGSTDTGIYPFLLNDPEDWKIHRIREGFHGFHLEHFVDDLYELCVKRQESDPRVCFVLQPDADVYHTRDLFRQVPGREGFVANAGRVDDFVKLASLTKFNAVEIEQMLKGHPDIDGALVGGDGRKRPFVIIQPSSTPPSTQKDVLDRIWPAFEQANQTINKEAQLTKKLVLITEPHVPLKRTDKGSLDRRSSIALYADQIDAMYVAAGFDSQHKSINGTAE